MQQKQRNISYFFFLFFCFALLSWPANATGQKDDTTLKILPTLKGHMARLGSLMNFLFRNIDDEKYTSELIKTVVEMQALIKGSGQFEPDKALLLLPQEDHEKALKAFQLCIKNASEKLNELMEKISNLQDKTPDKPVLLELDLIRRSCHSKFG